MDELYGPERLEGQGLDPNQHASGNEAIKQLLSSEAGLATTDFVATYRHDAAATGSYEAWSRRGLVRWERRLGPEGLSYRVVEVRGENPLERQDPMAIATIEEELTAAGATDPGRAFVGPEQLTYPSAYERISQLFDSPNAPDLVVNPLSYAFGRQPGQHGALDVVQSRSPLIFSGPGVQPGTVLDASAHHVDIAPTIAALMGFPLVDGRDASGRWSSERGVPPDVYLRRQDGGVIEGLADGSHARPERVYLILLDGQSHSELLHRLEADEHSIPNLRRLVKAGTMLRWGSITNFPSITWPSHNAIGTGAWCGHHDIVNPSYYLRRERETISPQGRQFDTAQCLSDEVETLFEAFHRVHGDWDGSMSGAFTASINEPCTRGADHASLERRLIGDRPWLIELTKETEHQIDPRWKAELKEQGHRMLGEIDNRGLAQARQLFLDGSHPAPSFVFHEFTATDSAGHDYGPHHPSTRDALDETDVRIGHILSLLEEKDLFDSTLFVVTSDHGMAAADVSLKGNPARIPERSGTAAVTTEPCIYLRDLAIEIEVAADGRTALATVLDNDLNSTGERPPVGKAEVEVAGPNGARVARARTDSGGTCGLAIPADLEPADLVAAVTANGFNGQRIRLDGEAGTTFDLRETLYG